MHGVKLLSSLGKTTPTSADVGLLLLRLGFGASMAAAHGWRKMLDVSSFATSVAKLGLPAPTALALAAAASESLGGVLLALGLLTRVAASSLLATMAVAAFVVHARDPFARKELALAYGAVALALAVAGPGRFSLDALLGRSKSQ
jgi:putative oxidoreductase